VAQILINYANWQVGGDVNEFRRTEKRGRVHTSTVTIAIIDEHRNIDPRYSQISDGDFVISWFSGSGKGGQHRNKVQNCCRVTHVPTGLQEARQGRSRNKNYDDAKNALIARLRDAESGETHAEIAADRKMQVGSGGRDDKVITIQFQNNIVKHHLNNKSMSVKHFMRGMMDKLFV